MATARVLGIAPPTAERPAWTALEAHYKKIASVHLRDLFADDPNRSGAAARCDGRQKVGCIVLGPAEGAGKVGTWLSTAAEVPGFIGFAVGRTVFWEPLVEWRSRKITRDLAGSEISRRYQNCVHIFEAAQVQVARAS